MSDLCCPSSDVKVYTYAYCMGKSMMTVFPLLHKFTNMPSGYNKLQDIYEGGPKKNRIFFKKEDLFTFRTKNT